MKPAAVIIVNLLVTAAAILIYHFVVDRDGPNASPAPRTVAREPEAESSPLAPIGVAPSYARFEALERRVGAAERALAKAAAAGVSPKAEAADVPSVTGIWTEEQLAAFRALLEEIETRKRQEQYGAMMRDTLRRMAKGTLTPDQEERAVALIVAFQRRVWELFPGGSGGSTLEERDATNAVAEKARGALEEELRALLPSEVATAILTRVQHFPARLPQDHIPLPPGDGK